MRLSQTKREEQKVDKETNRSIRLFILQLFIESSVCAMYYTEAMREKNKKPRNCYVVVRQDRSFSFSLTLDPHSLGKGVVLLCQPFELGRRCKGHFDLPP